MGIILRNIFQYPPSIRQPQGTIEEEACQPTQDPCVITNCDMGSKDLLGSYDMSNK